MSMTTDNFDKVCSFIDNSLEQIIELQTILTAIPALAPESGGQGEIEKCLALTLWLKAQGFEHLDRIDAPDTRVKSGIRPNLIATIPGKTDSPTLWIMSHLDIVPVGEQSLWHTDPFKVVHKDGKLYGRGVEDNQQGMISSIFAALSLLKNGITPEYTVKLLFVADEEVGSKYGIQYLLAHHKLFKKEDIIIIPDGGDTQGTSIIVAEKNLLWMRITTVGKQAHGSRPDEGANAHLANCELALLLNLMEEDFAHRDNRFKPPKSTFQPTKKEANVPNINTIPGEDVFCMDCRILPAYSLAQVRQEIRKRMDTVEKKYGVKISYTEEQSVESPATPSDAPVVRVLAEAAKRVYGVDAKAIGIGGGTVGSYLRIAGFDAAVWGKMDGTAHQPNEYTVLDDLTGDAKVMASIMLANK